VHRGQSCIKVQTSRYSKLAGVPVALIGLIGYVAILGSLLAARKRDEQVRDAVADARRLRLQRYLTYREVFSIHAICEECVTSAGSSRS
jgi:uncharacterized membrane protein